MALMSEAGNGRATIREIAELAGVSIATVSRVVNGREDVSAETRELELEVSLLERLMHGTTDGAVIILPEESSDELEALLNHGYRFVVIDPMTPLNERIPAVSAAHAAGADQAMKHLLSIGHTRIA